MSNLNYRAYCMALMLVAILVATVPTPASAQMKINKGDRICYIGNNLADRMQHHGWLETLIQNRFPKLNLVFRNLAFTGDEINKRPRSANFGNPDQWLTKSKADVIFAFFGYNESFAGVAGLDNFKKQLTSFIDNTLKQNYSGRGAPRLVLFSPIAHENLKSPHLPDGSENNKRLTLYAEAMGKVAKEKGVLFVDLFNPSRDLYAKAPKPLTLNGIHLLEHGNRALAQVIVPKLFGAAAGKTSEAQIQKLRSAVLDKNLHWFNLYRTVDGYNVYGGRSKLAWGKPKKISNADVMAIEMAGFEVMTANRDKRIWAVAAGGDLKIVDNNLPKQLDVQTNRPGKLAGGKYPFLSGEEAIGKMKIAEGMQVNLFASEEQFPELVNPVQMAVDTDGRLWASVWPTYPHWNPNEKMSDKLVILPDDNGDGKADRLIVFADKLNSVTGFEFWGGGVLVAAAPEILFLKDTDGDDVADVRIHMLQGVSSADTHHTANALVIGPAGALYWSRGVFHVTNMETPTGTFRSTSSGVYRFDPRTFEISFHFPIGPNPHGDVIDQWGYQFASDGTSGTGSYVAIGKGQGAPHKWYKKRVRPVPATGILSSSHFPPRNNGNFLICNAIGFLGVLQHEVKYDGADITAVEIEPILVSSDPNFRPTDIEVGGDGALYISDWANPLIGHMQHNMRDPNRDHKHGRVYRVTARGRPLVKPAKMKGKPIAQVLQHFNAKENGTRYRARLELSGRDTKQVITELGKWTAKLDPSNPAHEQLLLEALWVTAEHRVPNMDLLKKTFQAKEPRVRAAAIRTLGTWGGKVSGAGPMLITAARDPEALVRAEAVLAAVSHPGLEGAEVIFEVATRPTDVQLDFNLKYARGKINVDAMVADALKSGRKLSPAAQTYALQNVSAAQLVKMDRSEALYKALLTRGGIATNFRQEALDALAKKNGTSAVKELLAAIGRQETNPGGSLGDLSKMLTGTDSAKLKGVGDQLLAMASKSKSSQTRQVVYAALVKADGSGQRAWEHASKSIATLSDLLGGISQIKDQKALASLYPLVRPLMFKLPANLDDPKSRISASSSPGVSYEHYEQRGFDDVDIKTLNKQKANLKGKLKKFGHRVPKGLVDKYALKLSASIYVPVDGKYTFFTNSDDGSRLYINGKQVVNNDGKHGMAEKSGDVMLPGGMHSIVVTYFDNGGGDGLLVSWKGPGIKKQEIPAKALSTGSGGGGLQAAAVRAIGSLPGHEAEKFKDLATLLSKGKHREAAVGSILRIPESQWPRTEAQALGRNFVSITAETPLSMRGTPAYKRTIGLGHKLIALLPKTEADQIRAELSDLNLQVVVLRSVLEQMRYDRTGFTVLAGKPVRVIFENKDKMPHNVLIVEPGAAKIVGPLAEKMGAEGFNKHFIPVSNKILWATKLVNSGDKAVLNFVAPSEPGDYEYVCTFPGHWILMRGIMRVVTDPAELQRPIESRLTHNWKVEDLAKDLTAMTSGRSFEQGQTIFKQVGCLQCHKIRGQGGVLGPDLGESFKKWKGNRIDVLRQIIEPSKVVEEKYRAHSITTVEGLRLFGLISSKGKGYIMVVTNPQKPVPQRIATKDIIEQRETKMSLMPAGLLNRFKKQQILDLMAYIESKGDPNHTLFRK